MSSLPYGILAMNPDKFREMDGVVFDLASYARHCKPLAADTDAKAEPPNAEKDHNSPQNNTAPAPVFEVEPFHDGWYPAEDGRPPVPVMGGALPPDETLSEEKHCGNTVTVTRTVFVPAGSGSGSGSFVTSYITSYLSSGSGSYRFGSCSFWVGGYGLELI